LKRAVTVRDPAVLKDFETNLFPQMVDCQMKFLASKISQLRAVTVRDPVWNRPGTINQFPQTVDYQIEVQI
jgi:hypothetical protein